MKKYFILFVFLFPIVVFGNDGSPQVTDFGHSSRIYRLQVSLTQGVQYKFRTFSTDFYTDPVLHLLNSSNNQVAFNDDCSGDCLQDQTWLDSTLTFTPSVSGTYFLVMRHWASNQVGKTTTLRRYNNGSLFATYTNRPVGGTRVNVAPWTASLTNRLFFNYLNMSKKGANGAQSGDTVMYLANNTNTIVGYDDDGGAGYSSQIQRTSGSSSGTPRVFGGAYLFNVAAEGDARLIVDVRKYNLFMGLYLPANDSDWDGLSNQLESILNTNAYSNDTDADGLSDYIETYGVGNVMLPWEGASPVKKDVFVEVDYFGRSIGGNMMYYYKHHEVDIASRLEASFNYHGDINLHIDVDDYLGIMEDGSPLIYVECGTGISSDTFYLEEKRSDHFTVARNGIYTWVVAANRQKDFPDAGGRSCVGGYGDLAFTITAGWRAGGGTLNRYTGTMIHEYGHVFGLGHNGNGNSNANENSELHRSVMNYSFQNVGVPQNVWHNTPPLPPFSLDSLWRYSTDSPLTRPSHDGQNLTWQNILPSQAPHPHTILATPFACISSSSSQKKYCIDNPANPYCDCTFNEWDNLDLTAGGLVGNIVTLNLSEALSEIEQAKEMFNMPVFGLNGRIIAKNINELINSGVSFSKNTTKSDEKEYYYNLDVFNNEYWTDELKARNLSELLDWLDKRSLKEGQDYEIVKGSIRFK